MARQPSNLHEASGTAGVDIVLSFGSNLGDRKQNIITAVARMAAGGLVLRTVSSLYETKPVGVSHHPDYYNAIAVYRAPADNFDRCVTLLTALEKDLGRIRKTGKVLPRPIDIDVIFWGNRCFTEGSWIVPHPKFRQRLFVLKPLIEIGWGDVIDPAGDKTIAALLQTMDSDRQRVVAVATLEVP